MVAEDSVEPGRLASVVLVGPAAVVSSSESSSQPTSSSVEAAGETESANDAQIQIPLGDDKMCQNSPFKRSLLLASAISMPCLRK